MSFQVTKTYGHERGLSCVFRQPLANSHCSFLHGYALAFEFVFEADELDERNWVIDFGSLDALKRQLEFYFDHTLAVAHDDPMIDQIELLDSQGLADVRIFEGVGCEMFARFAYELAVECVEDNGCADRVRVRSCKVSEHGANSATYQP